MFGVTIKTRKHIEIKENPQLINDLVLLKTTYFNYYIQVNAMHMSLWRSLARLGIAAWKLFSIKPLSCQIRPVPNHNVLLI